MIASLFIYTTFFVIWNFWQIEWICDTIKQNESDLKKKHEKSSSFKGYYMHNCRAILFWNPLNLTLQCQRYSQIWVLLRTRKCNAFICHIYKSIPAISDSFCLITSHYKVLQNYFDTQTVLVLQVSRSRPENKALLFH